MMQRKNFVLRLISSLFYAGSWLVGSLCFFPFLVVLIGLFSIFASYEFVGFMKKNNQQPLRWKVIFFVSLWWLIWAIWFFSQDFSIKQDQFYFQSGFFVVLTWIFVLLAMFVYDIFSKKQQQFLSEVGFLTMIIWYIIYPLQGLVLFSGLDHAVFINWLVFVLLVVWSFDTFAYVVGSLFGRHLLLPQVSPQKTWEGLLGGYLLTILLFVGVVFLREHRLTWSLLFHLHVIIVLAFLGDLFESKLKRLAGVKDSGTFMPGHGGILDRLDSLLMVSFFYTTVHVIEALKMF